MENRIRPKKSLGQNFLKDENVAHKIISSLHLTGEDKVLEIGPGTGVLTKYIVGNAVKVIAVEIDNNLAHQLRDQFSDLAGFTLLHRDVLKISFPEIFDRVNDWRVVANLPYHITSPVLFKLFENRFSFRDATFMVQKEVAQRIVAAPGSKTYGILSVFSQFYADVKILFDVSKNVFYPVPEVDSAVVYFKFRKEQQLNETEEALFRKVVKGVFAQRRKMLRNSLKSIQDLNIDVSRLNVNLKERPEQLTVENFIDLIRQILSLHTKKIRGDDGRKGSERDNG